jgi:hypothetical protein
VDLFHEIVALDSSTVNYYTYISICFLIPVLKSDFFYRLSDEFHKCSY